MRCSLSTVAALLLATAQPALSQTFRRLGGCPTLGCVFPPDQADFLAGQYFDIRVEVHAPVNGSEASNGGRPNPNFSLTITREGGPSQPVTNFFKIQDSPLERWNFTYYEDLFAEDAGTPVLVNVAAKAYRRVALYTPGYYTATLRYNGGLQTVASWYVRPLSSVRKAKNILLFIGDGMTTNMITAARLIAHRQVNGRYQTRMAFDTFPVLGHQMTHSLDSFITDSANSATALYSGHKSTVNALGVYVDSSPNPFDDPKFESIAEIFRRVSKGRIGIVSTAFIADATPAGFTAHTSMRSQYGQVVDSFLNGNTNYSWPKWNGPDVLFGGGSENLYPPSSKTYRNQDYYRLFADRGYTVVTNKTSLLAAPTNKRTLGIFCQSNLPVWLDRNVYTDNLRDFKNDPFGTNASQVDLPGLKDMTLKAVDILQQTSGDEGWFLMSEAASVDKQMHALDYDRALGDLLELDDTVKATLAKLDQYGARKDTLVLVTADHGHGFDVMGSVDTKYLNAQDNDRAKRRAVGTYKESGESQYVLPPPSGGSNVVFTNGSAFPTNWDPRYTLFQGVSADPDRRENYQVHKEGPRTPAVKVGDEYYVNPEDATTGFIVNGTLPTDEAVGVHSLTDVPVYAMGPCQELFQGTYNNIDIFFAMADCLGLSRTQASPQPPPPPPPGYSGQPPSNPSPSPRPGPPSPKPGQGRPSSARPGPPGPSNTPRANDDESRPGSWWGSNDHWGY